MINLLHKHGISVDIEALKDLAKYMDMQEGPDFTSFLRDERTRAREERQAEYDTYNRAREQQQEADYRATEQQQYAYNRAREQQQEADKRAREQQQEAYNKDRDQKLALRFAEIQRETSRATRPYGCVHQKVRIVCCITRMAEGLVGIALTTLLDGIALYVYNWQPVNETSN